MQSGRYGLTWRQDKLKLKHNESKDFIIIVIQLTHSMTFSDIGMEFRVEKFQTTNTTALKLDNIKIELRSLSH